MEIIKQLNLVMEYVGAVHKSERNTHQSFNFRGIDNVVNAVSPALRKHGVVVVPCVNSSEAETLEIGQNRTRMGYVRVNVTYTFYALDGTNIATTVVAESMDSGDKATAKAMSVAFRTALLQTLCLPTDDLDPDADTYVRSAGVEAPKRSATEKQEAPQRSKVSPIRAAAGSKSEPSISDNQLKFLRELAVKVGADDETVVALSGGVKIEALSNPQASKIIEQLLSIKRGDATLTFNTDGTAELTTTK
jgi:hypothetical protein